MLPLPGGRSLLSPAEQPQSAPAAPSSFLSPSGIHTCRGMSREPQAGRWWVSVSCHARAVQAFGVLRGSAMYSRVDMCDSRSSPEARCIG